MRESRLNNLAKQSRVEQIDKEREREEEELQESNFGREDYEAGLDTNQAQGRG